MPETTQAESLVPVARLVSDAERMDFLPFYFGPRLMALGEHEVYCWMGELCKDYRGGFWNFYEVSNGGFYMAPATAQRFQVAVEGNGFEGELSADAAGIVATLFTLSHLCFAEGAKGDGGAALVDSFHALRDFVSTHPEAALILRAID
ncbi:MAG: antirestriction protein [Variovorax paradoxus]|uniref:Antirestriction protein n=1 Tax=Variovorax paradoxus TaxID=34073 RepID=A0A2W5QIV7_VARPD|nr:MAG: antirestriction protein [Variovorax paradoxus]